MTVPVKNYNTFDKAIIVHRVQGVFFTLGLPQNVQKTTKLIWARLGVSRTIYVNVDSPSPGLPYFNF